MTKLSNTELTKILKRMGKLSSELFILSGKIDNHSLVVYGQIPSDIDNDSYIDCCLGGCGISDGMTAEEFDESMKFCLIRPREK